MAVTVPNFSHGDTLSAAQVNQYKTAIDELASKMTGYSPARLVKTGDTKTYIVHSKRWLRYNDNGSIESLDGANTVSLSDPGPNAAFAFYDLDSLSWMAYGLGYYVINVDYAEEVDNPA